MPHADPQAFAQKDGKRAVRARRNVRARQKRKETRKNAFDNLIGKAQQIAHLISLGDDIPLVDQLQQMAAVGNRKSLRRAGGLVAKLEKKATRRRHRKS